jgi:cytochrome c556
MRLKTAGIAAAILCLGFSAVTAQETPQAKREQLMKQIGGSVGALGAIAKGEKPYDEATVKKSLTTINTNIKAFQDQFPAGSDANSEASPAIWKNMDDFRAKAQKLAGDTETLLASLPADQAGVQKAVQALGADCSSCHQTYRLKK